MSLICCCCLYKYTYFFLEASKTKVVSQLYCMCLNANLYLLTLVEHITCLKYLFLKQLLEFLFEGSFRLTEELSTHDREFLYTSFIPHNFPCY